MKFWHNYFYVISSGILGILTQYNEIRCTSGNLTIRNSSGRLYLDGNTYTHLRRGTTERIIATSSTTLFYSDVGGTPTGDINLGHASYRFGRSILKHSVDSTLCFTVTLNTDHTTPATQTIALPHTVPSTNYAVFYQIRDTGNANLCNIRVVEASKTDAQFEVNCYDFAGNLLDLSGTNQEVFFWIVFYP